MMSHVDQDLLLLFPVELGLLVVKELSTSALFVVVLFLLLVWVLTLHYHHHQWQCQHNLRTFPVDHILCNIPLLLHHSCDYFLQVKII
jgi:hypothetical protein